MIYSIKLNIITFDGKKTKHIFAIIQLINIFFINLVSNIFFNIFF